MGADAAEKAKSKGWFWWLFVSVIGALVVTAGTFTILRIFHHTGPPSIPRHPGAIVEKYADALETALQFFDVQKCTTIRSLYLPPFECC
jgi:endoglucanase